MFWYNKVKLHLKDSLLKKLYFVHNLVTLLSFQTFTTSFFCEKSNEIF